MLPKLQQSSIANSLRRDNPTTLLQCTISLTKARTSLKLFLANKITNPISLGRINMPPKIHILPLEIFLKSIYLKKNLKMPLINLFTSLHILARLLSILKLKVWEEKVPALCRKSLNFKNLSPNQEPFRKDKFLHQSLEGIMTEETYQSELTIKTPNPN